MLARQAPVRGKEKDRAGEDPAVALDDADDRVGGGPTGGLRRSIGGRSGDVDGAVPVAAEPPAALGDAGADAGAEVQAARVAGDERLGEDDELGTRPGRLRGEGVGPLQGP